jgi:hypothetical protein
MTLWYLNRSNAYVAQSQGGKPIENYDDPTLTASIDKLYTVVGAHVELDTKDVFEAFLPAFQQLIQIASQRAQQAKTQLPPAEQVVKETSMAETQRKAQADQSKSQYEQAKLQADMQKTQMDNQTKIAIENAKLTHETIQNIAQAQPPAMPQPTPSAQPMATMPQPQGAPNVNI